MLTLIQKYFKGATKVENNDGDDYDDVYQLNETHQLQISSEDGSCCIIEETKDGEYIFGDIFEPMHKMFAVKVRLNILRHKLAKQAK